MLKQVISMTLLFFINAVMQNLFRHPTRQAGCLVANFSTGLHGVHFASGLHSVHLAVGC